MVLYKIRLVLIINIYKFETLPTNEIEAPMKPIIKLY